MLINFTSTSQVEVFIQILMKKKTTQLSTDAMKRNHQKDQKTTARMNLLLGIA